MSFSRLRLLTAGMEEGLFPSSSDPVDDVPQPITDDMSGVTTLMQERVVAVNELKEIRGMATAAAVDLNDSAVQVLIDRTERAVENGQLRVNPASIIAGSVEDYNTPAGVVMMDSNIAAINKQINGSVREMIRSVVCAKTAIERHRHGAVSVVEDLLKYGIGLKEDVAAAVDGDCIANEGQLRFDGRPYCARCGGQDDFVSYLKQPVTSSVEIVTGINEFVTDMNTATFGGIRHLLNLATSLNVEPVDGDQVKDDVVIPLGAISFVASTKLPDDGASAVSVVGLNSTSITDSCVVDTPVAIADATAVMTAAERLCVVTIERAEELTTLSYVADTLVSQLLEIGADGDISDEVLHNAVLSVSLYISAVRIYYRCMTIATGIVSGVFGYVANCRV